MVHDEECGMQIRKVEDCDHWLKNYVRKLPLGDNCDLNTKERNEDLCKVIAKNTKILGYLQMVSEYVNANPALLNKNCPNVRTREAAGTICQTPLAEDLHIKLRREPADPESAALFDAQRTRCHQQTSYYGQTIPKQSSGLQFNQFMRPGTSFGPNVYPNPISGTSLVLPGPSFGGPVFQRGGFVGGAQPRDIPSGVTLLGSNIRATLYNLKDKNKELRKEDVESIDRKIRQMQALDKELKKTFKYHSEYIYLMDVLKDYRSEILSESGHQTQSCLK